MLLTSSWLIDLSILISIGGYLLHKYISWNYDYWKKKGIFYTEPKPFIGNLYDVLTWKCTIAQWMQNVYNLTNEPYLGVFTFGQPVFVLRSPEIIKQVLLKDFNYFSERTILSPDHDQVFAQALFLSKIENWKIMRPKLTPAFTSGKLKTMFPIIKDIGIEMKQYIKNNLGQLESKELSSKFATDVITRTVFGINAHCFTDENSEIRNVGRLFFEFNWRSAVAQTSFLFMHKLANFFKIHFADKAAVDYLKKVFWHTIKQREDAKIKGNDLIDAIVELRKNKEFCHKFKFEGDKILAHPLQFFAAGTETTSQTISFTLYELCLQPEIQNKARTEILNYLRENQEITYDGIKDLKYLEMCILETMRMYPVLPFLDRRCMADWTIPGTNTVINKGVGVYIPMTGLHYDENYFPEPNRYNPDRFADKSMYNQNGLYYIPFGEGPRICLGERFAMMNVKIALISILSEFVLEPTSATPVPLVLTKKSFFLQPEYGLPIRYVEYHP